MILADKIIRLRKKHGYSQEELAEKMDVSRQAVSKWEAAQSTPDLEKILRLGALFGVSTDYLLKDELEEEEYLQDDTDSAVRKVTLAQANDYLEVRRRASVRIAIATLLCIVSVFPLLLLAPMGSIAAVGIGVLLLFPIVAAGVAIYVSVGFQNQPYAFLDKEPFETEYGVCGMVRERQRSYRATYVKTNIFATVICVLSPVPLLCGAFAGSADLCILLLCLTLLIAGIGAALFIIAGVRSASMQRLLREGEFARKTKKRRYKEVFENAYWLSLVAIYLTWSFLSGDWHITWLVWPVGAVLFAAISAILQVSAEDDK